jgi:ribonuclease BN (tRNA processing enzyme)
LAKFNFKQGIDVYVGEGRAKDFETLVNPPFTIGYKPQLENVFNLQTEIRLHELCEGESEISFPVFVTKLHHAYGAHGYRTTLEGKTIVYTGDCGLTDHVRRLAEGADLLITECSNINTLDGNDNKWGHLDPVQAATLASESNVKRLILTHFDPSQYLTIESRKEAERRAREIFPESTAAVDDLEILL